MGLKEQILVGLESTLNDKKKRYIDKVNALLSAWEQLSVYISQSTPEASENLFGYVHKYTLQLLLHGDWPTLTPAVKTHLGVTLHRCITSLTILNIEAANRCRSLLSLVHNPWQHPTLHKILHKLPTTEEEVAKFFVLEGSQLLVMRLEVLCEGKCEDLALSLAESCFRYLRHSNVSQSSHIHYIKDVLLALLFRFKRNHDIIAQLKQLDLGEGLHLVQRYAKRNCVGARIWKHSDKVTEIAAHTILASAMVQCVEDTGKQKLLYDLIREWALIHVPKLSNSQQTLNNMIRKIIQTAESSLHIYTFCRVLINEFGDSLKSLCIELYIRGLTTNMNEVEQQKMKNDRMKISDAEIRLSDGFLQLADILQDNIMVCRECVLTAFSLNPTRSCLDRIKALAVACGKCAPQDISKCGFRVTAYKQDPNPSLGKYERTNITRQDCEVNFSGIIGRNDTSAKQESSLGLFHSCLNTKKEGVLEQFCSGSVGLSGISSHAHSSNKGSENGNYSTMNILDPDSLGLSQHLCDDLSTVLSSPRYQMLSWSMEWGQLSSKCEKYLEEYDSRRNTTTELKFLNIDYSQFKDWPNKVRDNNVSCGIEKGYENWIDYGTNTVDETTCSVSFDSSNKSESFDSGDSIIFQQQGTNKTKRPQKQTTAEEGFLMRAKVSKKDSRYSDSDNSLLKDVRSFSVYDFESKNVTKIKKKNDSDSKTRLKLQKLNEKDIVYGMQQAEMKNEVQTLLGRINKNNSIKECFVSIEDVSSLLKYKNSSSDPVVLKTLRMFRFPDNKKSNNFMESNSKCPKPAEVPPMVQDTRIRENFLQTAHLNPKVVLKRAEISNFKGNGTSIRIPKDIKHFYDMNIEKPRTKSNFVEKGSKLDILAQAVMRSDILLANSVPGMNSLDMIVPDTHAPTVQVVQLPNNTSNSLISQHSMVSSTSSETSTNNSSGLTRSKPHTDTVTTQTQDISTSQVNQPSEISNTQGVVSQQQTSLFGNSVSQPSVSYLSNADVEQRNNSVSINSSSFASSSMPLTSMLLNTMISRHTTQTTPSTQTFSAVRSQALKQSPVTSASTQVLCGTNQVLTVSNQLMNTLISASQEGSTQVSAHIQRVGHPSKQVKTSEINTNQTKTASVVPVYASKTDETRKVFNPNQTNSVVRLVVKDDGMFVEQFVSQNQASEAAVNLSENRSTQSTSSVTHSSFTQEHIIKLIKKKREARPKSESNIAQGASLPKFHHAFGRQMYQTGSIGIETNEVISNQNRFSEVSIESVKQEDGASTTSALSKASQTSMKDNENSVKKPDKPRTENDSGGNVQGSTVCSINSISASRMSSTPEKSTTEGRNVSELQSPPGVIFTCKVPVSISNSNLLQGKPVTILKTNSAQEIVLQNSQKFDSDTRTKESVIRSNMNALLAAALQSPSPLRSSASTVASTSSVVCQTTSSVKVPLATLESKKPLENVITGINKTRMPSPVQKTIRRQPVVQQGIQRYVRPLVQVTCAGNSISRTNSPVVSCIPLPLRTVQVLTANLSQGSVPNSKVENRRDSLSQSSVEQSSVSSTTLEQLREFESVLEQVTNTSQMKERSNVKLGSDQALAQSTSSSEFSSTQSKQSSLFTPSTPNTATSEVSSERVSLTFINKSSSNSSSNSLITTNTPKITATTPVVVVQSCSRPLASPALSITSQSSSSPAPSTTPTNNSTKINSKISKPKSKSVGKTTPTTSTIKVSTLPKPQQKTQEDEQTTQRIYAILDKYAEQLRNSPELKNKPAPRRRSNPPTNTAQSSKRKKSTQSKSKSSTSLASCSSGLDLSPGGSEDLRTLGSEDSSNGVSQISQVMNSPQNRLEELSTPTGGDVSSETSESLDSKDQRTQHRILITDNTQGTGRAVIVQENLQSTMLNVENSKVLAGKQVVVGSSATVPLTLSLPGTGNLKQVIFPVPADGRQFVVAKVPKMYRVHQVSGSPLLATTTGSGAVVLRQMCLNKSSANVKQVKVPVVSTISSQSLSNISTTSQQTVVLPTGAQSFTLATSSNADTESLGIALDNTILLNTSSASSISFLQRNLSKSVQQPIGLLTTARASPSQETSTKNNSFEISSSCIKSEGLLSMCASGISTATSVSEELLGRPIKIEHSDMNIGFKHSNIPFSEELPIQKQSSASVSGIPRHTMNKNWTQILTEVRTRRVDDGKENFEIKKEPASPESPGSIIKTEFQNQKDICGSILQSELEKEDGNKCKSSTETVIKEGSVSSEVSYANERQGGIVSNSKTTLIQQGHSGEPWHYNVTKLDNMSKNIKTECPTESLIGTASNKNVEGESCSQNNPLILSPSQGYKRKINNVENTIFQIAFRKSKSNAPIKEEFTQHRSVSALERELRLQKSLSEECEDLGVDKPSTSDLFPEAELLLDPDPLSRDSLAGELFSRGLESSSSGHDSPSRSPILSGKFSSSHWKKQKRGLLRHKMTCMEGLRWDSANSLVTRKVSATEQKSDSSRGSTPVNGGSAPSNFGIGSDDGKDCPHVFRSKAKRSNERGKCVNCINYSESHGNSGDTEVENNDSDDRSENEFSEVEDNCNDTDLLDTEGDSDSTMTQQCIVKSHVNDMKVPSLVKDLDTKSDNHIIEPPLSSSPKCLPPVITYNKRNTYRYSNFLSKDSLKTKSESDLTWYKIIKGVNLNKDSDNADSDIIDSELADKTSASTGITDESGSECHTPNGLQVLDEVSNSAKVSLTSFSEGSGVISKKRKSSLFPQKVSKIMRTRKGRKIGVYISSPGEDSGSSGDMLDSESCSGPHRTTRRASSRGQIKKGCPCLNGSPEPSKKKKESGLLLKHDKLPSPNPSIAISMNSRKSVSNKSVKNVSKKR